MRRLGYKGHRDGQGAQGTFRVAKPSSLSVGRGGQVCWGLTAGLKAPSWASLAKANANAWLGDTQRYWPSSQVPRLAVTIQPLYSQLQGEAQSERKREEGTCAPTWYRSCPMS